MQNSFRRARAGQKSGRLIAIVSAAATAACLSSPAFAADYPTGPVEITVTFAPGGTPDILARALSVGLSAD
ncbi:MAG: hypothetical protein Q8L99_08135, partial [Polycyclovorans sp.]|nr:hypothetical protein [Polycyclovorans sp.]